jgi:hypothetical protein
MSGLEDAFLHENALIAGSLTIILVSLLAKNAEIT